MILEQLPRIQKAEEEAVTLYHPLKSYVNDPRFFKEVEELLQAAERLNHLGALPTAPRHYQFLSILAIVEAYTRGQQRGYIELPTGTGKTLTIAYLLYVLKSPVSVITAPSTEILNQFSNTLSITMPDEFDVAHVTNQGDIDQITTTFRPKKPLIVLMTHSAMRQHSQSVREKIQQWQLVTKQRVPVIVDEAHLALGEMSSEVLRSLPAFLLGMTATSTYEYVSHDKNRLGRDVQDLFEEQLCKYSLAEAVLDGFTPSFEVFGMRVGYHDNEQLPRGTTASQVNRELLQSLVAEHVVQHIPNKRVVIIADTVASAQAITSRINSNQPDRSRVLSGQASHNRRSQVLAEFNADSQGVLCGVNIVGTGLDLKDVDVVIIANATTSATQVMQALGRGLRLKAPNEHENNGPSSDASGGEPKQVYFIRAAHAHGKLNELIETALGIPLPGQKPSGYTMNASATIGDMSLQHKQSLLAFGQISAEYLLRLLESGADDLPKNGDKEGDDVSRGSLNPNSHFLHELIDHIPADVYHRIPVLATQLAVAIRILHPTETHALTLKIGRARVGPGRWQVAVDPHLTQLLPAIAADMRTIAKRGDMMSQREAQRVLAIAREETSSTQSPVPQYVGIASNGGRTYRLLCSDVKRWHQDRERRVSNRPIAAAALKAELSFPYVAFLNWLKLTYPDRYVGTTKYPSEVVAEFRTAYAQAWQFPLTGQYLTSHQLRDMAKQDKFWGVHNFLTWAGNNANQGEVWTVYPPYVKKSHHPQEVFYHEDLLQRYLQILFFDKERVKQIVQDKEQLEQIPEGWVTVDSVAKQYHVTKIRLTRFVETYVAVPGVVPFRRYKSSLHPAICVSCSTVACYFELQVRTRHRTENPFRDYLPREFVDYLDKQRS